MTPAEYKRHNDAIARRVQTHFNGTDPDLAGLARIKSAAPIKPSASQLPADIGLFSDESSQLDLIDMFMD